MKTLLFYCALLPSFVVFSQTNIDSSVNTIDLPIRGRVILRNQEHFKIRGIDFYHNDTLRFYSPPTAGTDASVVRVSTNGFNRVLLQEHTVPVSQIRMLQHNNHAFYKGAGIGVLVGFGLGYVLGYGTYEDKINRTEEDNKDRRNSRAALFGLGGMVPTGLAGALVGGLFIKKRFTINGSRDRLDKALEKIYR